MKRLSLAVAILALLFLVASCVPQIVHLWKQQEARNGLGALVAHLPEINGFDTLKELFFDHSITAYSQTCYYATSYVIIGTSLPESEAVNVYAHKLQELGWIPQEEQYDFERLLYNGINGRAVVFSYDPGTEIKDAVDAQVREAYQSVIYVRLVYMIPSRDEC